MSMRHSDARTVPAAPLPRDTFGTVALAAAAVSFVGFAVLVVGHQIAPHDFNNGKHPSAANNVAFFAYVLGVLVALFLGGAVWFYGRTGPRSRAALATYYGVVFFIVAVIAAVLGV